MIAACAHLIAAWALLLPICAWAQVDGAEFSQRPAPSGGEQRQRDQKQPNKHKSEPSDRQPGTKARALGVEAQAPKSQGDPAERKPKGANEAFADWWPWFDANWTTALFTFALCVIGAITAVVLYCQARHMQRTVDGMRDTAQRQLRAYVAFEKLYFLGFEPPSETKVGLVFSDQLKIRVKNYGPTPAHDMRIWANSLPSGPTEGFVAEYGEALVGAQMLHPGQGYSCDVWRRAGCGPKDYFNVYGKIIYRDAYTNWWITRFFYWHETHGVFVPTTSHNREDGPYKTEEEALAA